MSTAAPVERTLLMAAMSALLSRAYAVSKMLPLGASSSVFEDDMVSGVVSR